MTFTHHFNQRFHRMPQRLAGAATLCAAAAAWTSYTQDAASKPMGLSYAFLVPDVVTTTIKQQFPLEHGFTDSWKLKRNRLQDYELQNVIGEGGFGLVHVGRHKVSNARVAIKRMPKKVISKENFLQEVEILRQVGGTHNVLELREAFETSDAYILVTELVQGRELYDDLMEHGVFSEQRAKELIRLLAETLVYLHSKHVVHADVKPENILLDHDKQTSLRLIDFGQSFRLHDESRHKMSACTTAYASPELINHRDFSCAMDVWSLGVVFYIIMCGLHPFDPSDDATDDEIRQRILDGNYDRESVGWECMSDSARDLLSQMLVVDPAKRISAPQVLEHEWIANA